LANGLTLRANYTYSHCISDPSIQWAGDGTAYTNQIRKNDRGNCNQDRRQIFTTTGVYATPGQWGRALGGWRISGIWSMSSGAPFSVQSGQDTALAGYGTSRANQVLANPFMPNPTAGQWLNPAAFVTPPTGTWGTSGAYSFRGPSSVRIDAALSRIFKITESQSVEFRWEAFNLPNHVNLANPITNFSLRTFGKIQSAGDPRIMQIAMKYVF
jgi:hypothetical protein